jgi:hypothetical protein
VRGVSGPSYTGPCQQNYFYLVGKGKPEEKLFHFNDLPSASAYSSENRLTIQTVQGRRLPEAAVRELCAE